MSPKTLLSKAECRKENTYLVTRQHALSNPNSPRKVRTISRKHEESQQPLREWVFRSQGVWELLAHIQMTQKLLLLLLLSRFSHVRLFATPRTAAYQAPPSMGVSRQEYWSGVPLPSPNDKPSLAIHKSGLSCVILSLLETHGYGNSP